MTKTILYVSAILVLFFSAGDLIGTEYNISALDVFGAPKMVINNSGHYAGIVMATPPELYSRPVLNNGSTLINIAEPSNDFYDVAALNNNDVVAGTKNTSAYVWSIGSGMEFLGSLGGGYSFAYGINDNGVIVGRSWTGSYENTDHAFYWDQSMHDLTPGAIYSTANGINNSGQIAGTVKVSILDQNPFRAFRFSTSGGMQALGTLGNEFCHSMGNAINENGHVVGMSQTTLSDGETIASYHAFLWDGTMHDLGTLASPSSIFESYAYAINASDQVVGRASTTGSPHAFLYDNGTMKDLNDLIDPGLGWELIEAFDINDSGQIVGMGSHNGQSAAYILNPVPEPCTLVMLICGAAGLLVYKWRRKASQA